MESQFLLSLSVGVNISRQLDHQIDLRGTKYYNAKKDKHYARQINTITHADQSHGQQSHGRLFGQDHHQMRPKVGKTL
jgi:hypothetical protein